MAEAVTSVAADAFTAITGEVLSGTAFQALSSVASIAVPLGVGLGLNYASQLLRNSASPGATGIGNASIAGINAPEIRGSVRQSTPAQRIGIGRIRQGGAFFFFKTVPPKRYIGHLYSSRRLTTIKGVWIGENLLGFNSPAFDTIVSPFAMPDQPNYPGRFRACFQSGSQDQGVNPLLLAAFPDIGAGFRWPGVANAVYELNYGADFDEFQALWASAIPDIQIDAEWAPHYDPRDPTQRLPDDPNDPDDYDDAASTWKYTDTAALVQAWWAWDSCGLRVGPSRVDWDKVARAADRDEEIVGHLNGVLQKRYSVAGVIRLDQPVNTVMEALLTANRGFLIKSPGRLGIGCSLPTDPVVTITDDMVIGPYTFRRFKDKRDFANEVRPRFVAPERSYEEADGPIRVDAASVEADGEPLDVTIRFPMTPTHQRTQRLTKAALDEFRLERNWSGPVTLALLGLQEGDVVRRESRLYPAENALYRVQQWELLGDGSGIAIVLAEYDPALENDWNPNTDELPFELADVDLAA